MQIGGTINGVASFVHSTPVLLTGCNFRRDGANGGAGGGGFAGIYNANYGAQVVIAGLQIFPGVNDNGSGTNSPQIGILADAGSIMSVGAAYVQAATTAITDNSGGGINWDNSVVTATGTTAAPVVVAAPFVAAYQGKSLTLSPGASPATDPLKVQSNASGNRVFGIANAGSGTDTFKLTSDGKIAWGPTSSPTNQDVSLNRAALGILSVTDSGTGNSAMLRVAASASQTSTTELFSAVCNAAGDVSYIAKVTGDTQNRWRVDSSGQQQWGTGALAADVTFGRLAAGIVGTSVGSIAADQLGQGFQVKEGSNAKQGVATLAAGTVVVSNTSVTASSRIQLTAQDNNSTGALRVSARTAGTSFTITSSNAGDTGVVAFFITEPAP
jgi:hypothetical protein